MRDSHWRGGLDTRVSASFGGSRIHASVHAELSWVGYGRANVNLVLCHGATAALVVGEVETNAMRTGHTLRKPYIRRR